MVTAFKIWSISVSCAGVTASSNMGFGVVDVESIMRTTTVPENWIVMHNYYFGAATH